MTQWSQSGLKTLIFWYGIHCINHQATKTHTNYVLYQKKNNIYHKGNKSIISGFHCLGFLWKCTYVRQNSAITDQITQHLFSIPPKKTLLVTGFHLSLYKKILYLHKKYLDIVSLRNLDACSLFRLAAAMACLCFLSLSLRADMCSLQRILVIIYFYHVSTFNYSKVYLHRGFEH